MIIALEIGSALSLIALIAAYAAMPKPKRVPVRARRTDRRQG